MSATLDAAIGYADHGWPVFPLAPDTKVPIIASPHRKGGTDCKGECGRDGHGFYDATTDADKLRHWWAKHPRADIGLRCGVACDVLDIDHTDFLTGVADLPDCETLGGPVARSGGGKWHLYFKSTGLGRRVRFSKWCDWLGAGGLAVLPPSSHKSGNRYQWFAPFELELTDPPAELVKAVDPPRPTAPPPPRRGVFDEPGRVGGWSAAGLIGQVAAAPDGERNSTLWWAARKVGLDVHDGKATEATALDALDRLATVAERTGLRSKAVDNTIASGYSTGKRGVRGRAA